MNERDVSLCALWGSGKWFNINPKCHQYDTDFEAFMYEFSLFTTSNSNACTDTQNLVWIIRAKQNEFKVGLKGQSPSDPRKPLHASHVWKTLLQPSVHYILLNCNIYIYIQNLVWIVRGEQNEFKVGLNGQSPSGPRKPLHASHVWKTLLQPSVHYILLNCNIYMSSTSISVHPLFWTYIGES